MDAQLVDGNILHDFNTGETYTILSSELSGRNKVFVSNILAVRILRCAFGEVKFSQHGADEYQFASHIFRSTDMSPSAKGRLLTFEFGASL